MLKQFLLITCGFFFVVKIDAQCTNLITNGDFTNAQTSWNYGFPPSPATGGLFFTGGNLLIWVDNDGNLYPGSVFIVNTTSFSLFTGQSYNFSVDLKLTNPNETSACNFKWVLLDNSNLIVQTIGNTFTTGGNGASGIITLPNNNIYTNYPFTFNVGFASGTYRLALVWESFEDGVGKDLTIDNISLTPVPNIQLALSSTPDYCNNNGTATVVATGGAAPLTYSWNTSPIQTLATSIDLSNDTYTITVTDASGCFKTDSILVTGQDGLELSLTSTSVNCITNFGTAAVTVTGGSPSYTYLWSDGGTNSTISVPNSGTYSVLVTDNFGCSVADSVVVDPAIIPSSIASSNGPVCEGETLILSASNSSVTGSTFNWSGPNGFTSLVQNPIISNPTLLESGTYILTVSANACSSTSSINVVVKQKPLTIVSSNSPVCSGESLNLVSTTCQIVGSTYHWTGPNNYSSFNQSSSILNSAENHSGDYTILVEANGCSFINTINVEVNEKPETIATSNSPICEGETLDLNATGNTISGAVFNWTGPLSFVSAIQNNTISSPSVLNSGIYTVTTSANGCTNSSEILVEVLMVPVIEFTADILSGCQPLIVHFSNYTTPISSSVLWSFGDGTTSTITGVVSHTFTEVGDFDISLTSTSSGCTNTKNELQMIHVDAVASANFRVSDSTVTIFNPTFDFINLSSNSNSYEWNFGDDSFSNIVNPSHDYQPNPGSYDVQLIANNIGNCPDTTMISIMVVEPLVFYVPNTFTPDNDKYNEVFMPIMTSGIANDSYEMKIYNRWGEFIFMTNEIGIGWDGKLKDEDVQDGTFTWVINFKDKVTNERYVYNGTVNILK